MSTPADDDVPPRLVDLEDEALDRAADVIADVGRPANGFVGIGYDDEDD